MSGHRGTQRGRKPMINKLSSSRALEPQLVVTPPLQNGVDEADLLLALETFPDFKHCFFFPHFYLAVFATVHAADYALARLNTILPAPVDVKWDDWKRGDPQNGPYPEVSIAVESCHVFIVRNFLSATVLRKLTFKFLGLLGGLPTLRGFIITYESSKQAFAFLDYLTAKTNLLPYFVVGHADPTPTAPRPEFDRYFANQCNELNGPDQNSDLSSVRMFPHGDEISVLMDLCSSFPGWERVHLLGDQEAIVDFNNSVNARRFVRYLTRQTASVSRLEPRPTRDDPVAPADIADSPTIHLILTRKWQFSSKHLAQKRCRQWLESYQGFRTLAAAAQAETISVTFASTEYARAAAHHIASTTNFLKGAEGFFSAERLKVWVNPAWAFNPELRGHSKIPQGLVAAKQRQIELREIHNQEHDAAHRAYGGSHEGHSHDHEPHATAQAAEGATIPELQPPGHSHPSRDCTRYILQTLPSSRRITREEHEANMLKFQSQILAELETMKSSNSLKA
ncbi:hypothetical protein HDU89_005316 [Geranomyces variabilis]|nr:hypothetical protein HDU89_005316 [Geranomyces variabilis]